MCALAVVVGVKNIKIFLQPCTHVVCVEDGVFCCSLLPLLLPTCGYNHRNKQYRCRAIRRGTDGIGISFVIVHMARQKWLQVFCTADGPHARTAATMRDSECFVQVKVANISTD